MISESSSSLHPGTVNWDGAAQTAFGCSFSFNHHFLLVLRLPSEFHPARLQLNVCIDEGTLFFYDS